MKKSLLFIISIFILALGVQAQNNPAVTTSYTTPFYETTQQNLSIRIENQQSNCNQAINNATFSLSTLTLNNYVSALQSWSSSITNNILAYFTTTAAIACDQETRGFVYGVTAPILSSNITAIITLTTKDISDETSNININIPLVKDVITPSIVSYTPNNYSFVKNETIQFSYTFLEQETGLKTTGLYIGYDDNTAPLSTGVVSASIPFICSTGNLCTTNLNPNGLQTYIDYRIVNVSDNAWNLLDDGNNFPNHLFVDNQNPSVTLLSPNDAISTNNNTLNLQYIQSDNSFVAPSPFNPYLTCYTSIDTTTIDTKTNVKNGTTNSITADITNQTDGSHYWYTQCLDIAGNSKVTGIKTFTLDRTAPTITLSSLQNNTIIPQSQILLDITDAQSSVDKVYYTYNSTSGNIFTTSPYMLDALTLTDGTYNFLVTANDTLGNTGTTSFTFTIDTQPPTIVSLTPANGTISNKTAIFTYTTTDNHATQVDCQVDVDGNQTTQGTIISNDTINNGSTKTVTTTLTDGIHSYGLNCKDSVQNSVRNGLNYIIIDDTSPRLDLVKPANQVWFNYNTPYIIYNVSDKYGINKCDLYVNNLFNQTNQTQIIENDYTTFNMNWTEGPSTWRIECTDNYNNKVTSSTQTINVDTIKPTQSLIITPPQAEYQTDNIQIKWAVTDTNKQRSLFELFYPNGTLYTNTTDETTNLSINKLTLSTTGNYSIHIYGNDTTSNELNYYDNLTIKDTTAPTITSSTPTNQATISSGTTTQLIELTTDEQAICRVSDKFTEFNNMTQMNYTTSTYHNYTALNLNSGNSYNYYFQCEDNNSNRMSNTFNLTFSVAAQQSGGGGSSGGGGGGGGSNKPITEITPIVQPKITPIVKTNLQEDKQEINNNKQTHESDSSQTDNIEPTTKTLKQKTTGLLGITGSTITAFLTKKTVYTPVGAIVIGALSWAGFIGTNRIITRRRLKKVQFRPESPSQEETKWKPGNQN